ncbi:hypothetical protein PCYB_003710 [Plasmodium cynomolgi strain B]|uniref:CYIR protein n=1 Tax=Plasmodium cynomolgi (strain B) TaxID=1120755 RepID=K6VJN3_PLACD|nr:hypothetical protein PCYB_003710 [Plasmodium cynomolgi strain B]GAB69622.1 hypothetical protein PCYB_003710 [Plasmodium cynomolgi strain B]
MNYIDDIRFKKMKDLYGLYDAYDSFSQERHYVNEDQGNCMTLRQLIVDYNDIIEKNKKYESSIYLYKELKNIKCLIERDHLFYSGHALEYEKPCKYNKKTIAPITIPLISGMTGMFGLLLYKVNNNFIYICYIL